MRPSRRLRLATGLLAALITLGASSALAEPEKRCGWVVNPTPGNWWLTDRDDTWVMATQGADDEAAGMDRIGDISEHDYVASNGYYGYACGCMAVETDPANSRITVIYSFEQLKLSKCERDRDLPDPE